MSDCKKCERREQFHDRYFCVSCTRAGSDAYMVHDSVWFEANLGKKDFCCLACLEGLLGRPITLEDLTPARINDPLRMMYSKGQNNV